jgi:hypothetical protein
MMWYRQALQGVPAVFAERQRRATARITKELKAACERLGIPYASSFEYHPRTGEVSWQENKK